MRMVFGIIFRVLFWLTAIYFVLGGAVGLWVQGNYVYSILALVFFPLSYFYIPLTNGLWWLLLMSIGLHFLSVKMGMPPAE